MRYPVERIATKHERIVKEHSPRFAAVTWTLSRFGGNLKFGWTIRALNRHVRGIVWNRMVRICGRGQFEPEGKSKR